MLKTERFFNTFREHVTTAFFNVGERSATSTKGSFVTNPKMRCLFVRPVQIEFAFVLDEAVPKVIDPAASAQNIAPETLMRCKVNCYFERVTERLQG